MGGQGRDPSGSKRRFSDRELNGMVNAREMRSLLGQRAETLVRLGIPRLIGLADQDFASRIDLLGSLLDPGLEVSLTGNIPLCIAFRPGSVDLPGVMSRIEAKSAKGVIDMTPLSPEAFDVIDEVRIPSGEFYLLIDVDTGRDLLNVSPEDALAAMRKRGRTPLTLEEGVALTAQYPELLTDKARYNCIQMPGSRKRGDQRVPSIWFSRGEPRLGWCWDRNIHTWLGSASAAFRLGDKRVASSAGAPSA
jgi:hypothetical protein